MQSRGARIGVLVAAVAVVVVLFINLNKDDGDDSTVATSTPTEQTQNGGGGAEPASDVSVSKIEVENGQPVGGVQEIAIDSGAKAEIVVSSPDTTEEVHFHGYDIPAEMSPDQPAKIEFDATIDGVFELELEDSATQIAEVTVGG
jgi:hypothetical protein